MDRLAAVGLALSLIGAGLQRQHLPPLGPDEGLAGLTLFILLLQFRLMAGQSRPNGFFSLSRLLITLLFSLGIVLAKPESYYLGQEPLPLWGAVSRWLILAGLAGLFWLALLAGVSLWREAGKHPQPPTQLGFESEASILLAKPFQPLIMLFLLLGISLFSLRQWWLWGPQVNQGLSMMVVWLLLLAAHWLRFTTPYRRWWAWSLTILAFLVALPALISIMA